MIRAVARAAAVLVVATALAPWLSAQEVEDLPLLVLRELRAAPAACPDELGAGWTCGRYRGSFSRLKFDLEVELDLKDYEARSLGPWKLRDGRYTRSWNVHEQKVTMVFDPALQQVMLRQGPLDKPEPSAEPEGDAGTNDGGGR